MERELKDNFQAQRGMTLRHVCIKLLEGDKEIVKHINHLPNIQQVLARKEKEQIYIEKLLREDPESAFTNARYGFIAGGLQETLTEKTQFADKTKLIDTIVTNKYIGFPIFFIFMWIMFESTFSWATIQWSGLSG